MTLEQWYPCEWRPSGLRLFSPKKRMAQRLLIAAVIIVLGISLLDIWALLLLVPLLLGVPVLQLVMIRYGHPANEYFVRDWKGLPQVGEYAVMRGHLFLRVPGMTEAYVKPTSVSRTSDVSFDVRGKWLKRFEVT